MLSLPDGLLSVLRVLLCGSGVLQDLSIRRVVNGAAPAVLTRRRLDQW